MNQETRDYFYPSEQEPEETFSIPESKADIEEKIIEWNEKIETDKANKIKKQLAPVSGIPEEALPAEVKNADMLYERHLAQLSELQRAKKNAA